MAWANHLTAVRLLLIIAAFVIAAAVAFLAAKTTQGAAIIAGARCAGHWLKLDRASYQACFDFEREQILEERERGHTRFDE